MNKISTIRLIIFILTFTSLNFLSYSQCLTDTLIYYETNDKSQARELYIVRRSIFQYNSADQITEELVQNRDTVNQIWTNATKTTRTYDANKNLLSSLLETWDNKWINASNTTYKYDGNNWEIEQTRQIRGDFAGTLVNTDRITNTYYSTGATKVYLFQSWNTSTNKWENKNKSTYTLTSFDRHDNSVSEKWIISTQTWEKNDSVKNKYDAGQNYIGNERLTWNSIVKDWVKDRKEDVTLDGNNNRLSLTNQSWIASSGTWQNNYAYTYKYDANNQRTETIYKTGVTGSSEWLNETMNTYKYDANLNMTERIQYNWDSTKNDWVKYLKNTTIYNGSGIVTDQLSEVWDKNTGKWINNQHVAYGFNADGFKISYDQYSVWDSKSEVYGMHNRIKYICSLSTYIPDFNWNNEISIFPNPVNSNILNIKIANNATYQIFNVLGMLVQSGNLEMGENKIDIPGHLPNDIYLIKISNGGLFISTHKVILSRL